MAREKTGNGLKSWGSDTLATHLEGLPIKIKLRTTKENSKLNKE